MTAADVRDDAYLELRDGGRFGESGAHLLMAVVSAVAGSYRASPSYPTMNEEWDWTDLDVQEAINEFLVHLDRSGKFAALAVVASDGSSLETALTVRCRSWLQDRSRMTNVGAFIVKLKDTLKHGSSEGAVVGVETVEGQAWRRPEDSAQVYAGSDEPLVDAAMSIEVPRLAYRGSERRDPITDWRGLLSVVLAVLGTALSAVLQDTLRRVGVRRFGIDTRGDESFDRLSDAHEAVERAPDPYGEVLDLVRDPADSWLVEAEASRLLDALDPTDVAVLDAKSESIDNVMTLLDVKKSAAHARVSAARTRVWDLASAYGDDGFTRAVLGRALIMASMKEPRTVEPGSSSVPSGGA